MIEPTLDRLDFCFRRIRLKYYHEGNSASFSPFNTDQYATFLYFLANSAAKLKDNTALADRLYALNKALHGIDIFHGVQLPDVFLLVHCVGTVLGRASYGDYLVVYQSVTVGGNLDLEYPTIGKSVGLFAGSSVIGRCSLGDDSMMAAGSLIVDRDVPSQSACFGSSPNNTLKAANRSVMERYFWTDADPAAHP